MAAPRPMMHVDPDAGIPDLIRRLSDDSRRLASDEVRLAKLELHESLRSGARGTLMLALAFGAAVVALVGLTMLLIFVLGALTNQWWAGALIVAALELGLAWLLITRGVKDFKKPAYTLPAAREELRETLHWAKNPTQS